MDINAVSFLIKCDKNLNILTTYWYFPAFLFSPYQKNLSDLFAFSTVETIKALVNAAMDKDTALDCNESFAIANMQTKVSLCILAVKDKLIIHGIDSDLLNDEASLLMFKEIVHRFMRVIKISDNDLVDSDNVIIREQFERIQKLNNQLINTQRELKKANAKLNQLNDALNNRLVKDALTGLVSRYQYREEIKLAINKQPEMFGVFTFIDLDDFKRINDTYGHNVGDEFLIAFADRLKTLPFDNSICIRIAGDEFGVYIHGYNAVTAQDIKYVWDYFNANVTNNPIKLSVATEEIKCSLGMAVYGQDTKDIYELIEFADFAMYQAKKTGKNAYKQFKHEDYIIAKKLTKADQDNQ
ncbi:MAG: GGDEF domain-containing protein [Erysipelotrichaceae bacterium]|nr:GGDEF domain-containing protein [Erysipelotrichaceae bacterium]